MIKKRNDLSWGRLPYESHLTSFGWRSARLPENSSMLPYGNGRSYGDSCINERGTLLQSNELNHFISFDCNNGTLSCEAGVTFEEILHLIVGQGWFLPVTPGTRFITIGGAIANDVHGKNHHIAGCFGNHVIDFRLLRSDGSVLTCSQKNNKEMYCATIGGLGLTGYILEATIQLKPIQGSLIAVENTRYQSLDEFLELSEQTLIRKDEYVVAWVDCLAKGKNLGRGHFTVGNHSSANEKKTETNTAQRRLSLPVNLPNMALNSYTIRTFNTAYYIRQLSKRRQFVQHYNGFFYPLDAIKKWNRAYGSRGFYQYQCVVPDDDETAIRKIMTAIAKTKSGSFLTVLKKFGTQQSLGMLSFPSPGITFALDFANNGQETLDFLSSLDRLVMAHGGKVYPAKDSRMSEQAFKTYYPNWEAFNEFIDPKFSSSFWRRVMGESTR